MLPAMQKCVLENSELLRMISHEFHIYKQPWLNNSSRSQGFPQAHGLETKSSTVLPCWLGIGDTASLGEVSNLWRPSVINPLLSPKAIFLCTWHYCYLWWSEDGGGGTPWSVKSPWKVLAREEVEAHLGLAAGRWLHSSALFHPGVEQGRKQHVCFHLSWW